MMTKLNATASLSGYSMGWKEDREQMLSLRDSVAMKWILSVLCSDNFRVLWEQKLNFAQQTTGLLLQRNFLVDQEFIW